MACTQLERKNFLFHWMVCLRASTSSVPMLAGKWWYGVWWWCGDFDVKNKYFDTQHNKVRFKLRLAAGLFFIDRPSARHSPNGGRGFYRLDVSRQFTVGKIRKFTLLYRLFLSKFAVKNNLGYLHRNNILTHVYTSTQFCTQAVISSNSSLLAAPSFFIKRP